MPMWKKLLNFYGRYTVPFTALGFILRGLPFRPLGGSFDGQTWLVTGATGGIGKAIATGAAKRGARVFAAGRNAEALNVMAAASKGLIVPMVFDLNKVGDNIALADAIAKAAGRIDVLANNIGKLEHAYIPSPDGFESSYALNLLGHYALTERLIELKALDSGVIVNMASGGLYNSGLSVRRLEQKPEKFSGVMAYAAHKRAQIALSDRWNGQHGIRAYTMHPGWVKTPGVAVALPGLNKNLGPILRTPAQGADTALWLAARKPTPVEGALWFDRKPRSSHAYEHSKTPEVEPEVVFAKLAADVARATGAVAAA